MTSLHWEHQGKAACMLHASYQVFYSYEKSHWWPLNRKLCVIISYHIILYHIIYHIYLSGQSGGNKLPC